MEELDDMFSNRQIVTKALADSKKWQFRLMMDRIPLLEEQIAFAQSQE
jgi:hypothetical protein